MMGPFHGKEMPEQTLLFVSTTRHILAYEIYWILPQTATDYIIGLAKNHVGLSFFSSWDTHLVSVNLLMWIQLFRQLSDRTSERHPPELQLHKETRKFSNKNSLASNSHFFWRYSKTSINRHSFIHRYSRIQRKVGFTSSWRKETKENDWLHFKLNNHLITVSYSLHISNYVHVYHLTTINLW